MRDSTRIRRTLSIKRFFTALNNLERSTAKLNERVEQWAIGDVLTAQPVNGIISITKGHKPYEGQGMDRIDSEEQKKIMKAERKRQNDNLLKSMGLYKPTQEQRSAHVQEFVQVFYVDFSQGEGRGCYAKYKNPK
jgi:hypothetical protein